MSTPDAARATTDTEADRLSGRIKVGYSMGSLVTGAFGTVPGLLLLPYLTDTLAVPAFAAGLLVLLPKAWDVLFNPVAGRISDRTTSRFGARRPFLILGGSALAVCFAALFAGPDTGSVAAMPAELTEGVNERTRLTAWRIAVLAVAILVSGAGAPAVRDAVGGLAGYRVMGIGVGLLILIGAVGVFFGTARARVVAVKPTVSTWAEVFDAIRQCRPFRLLLGAYVMQGVAVGTLLAGVEYVAKVALGDQSLQAVMFAAFVGPAILVMPLLQWVGRNWGKRAGFVVATVVFAVAVASLVAAGVVPVGLVIAGSALAGVGYAGITVFPLAMLADVIGDEERRTGQFRAGLFAGVWTAGETLGLALGPGLYGLVLAMGGYVSSGADQEVVQPSSAVTAVVLGAGLLPAIFALGAIPLLTKRKWREAA
jgi:Na+/melibiose symporter-like transporter